MSRIDPAAAEWQAEAERRAETADYWCDEADRLKACVLRQRRALAEIADCCAIVLGEPDSRQRLEFEELKRIAESALAVTPDAQHLEELAARERDVIEAALNWYNVSLPYGEPQRVLYRAITALLRARGGGCCSERETS